VKILWLNLRKRGRNTTVLRALERLVEADGCDLLMLQETFTPRDRASHLSSRILGAAVHLSTDLSVFAPSGRLAPELCVVTPRLVAVRVGPISVLNVHFSPYSRVEREVDLSELQNCLGRLGLSRLIIGGDFNFAPRACDGLHACAESSWTGPGERQRFQQLLSAKDLVDFLAPPESTPQYTITRSRAGAAIEFRCDLVLCSRALVANAKGRYLHETRLGPWAFTDHSGIYFEVGKDEPQKPA
jgi:endonuclease/exonuclease/phosphatase family metal-dependent hydrolase